MRLSKRIFKAIKQSIDESFGSVDIYLFGSRTDDEKSGGDIDIAVDVELSRSDFRKKKVEFTIAMMKKNLDLKIDLVRFKNRDILLSSEIQKNSVLL